jgi:hypothetical protein
VGGGGGTDGGGTDGVDAWAGCGCAELAGAVLIAIWGVPTAPASSISIASSNASSAPSHTPPSTTSFKSPTITRCGERSGLAPAAANRRRIAPNGAVVGGATTIASTHPSFTPSFANAAAAASAVALAEAVFRTALEPAWTVVTQCARTAAAAWHAAAAAARAVDGDSGEEGSSEEVADAGAGRLRLFLGQDGEAAPPVAAAAAAAVAAAAAAFTAAMVAAAAARAADATEPVRDVVPWGGRCSCSACDT